MVHESLASVLRSGRDVFNAKFAEARREYPELDGASFNEFVESTIDPIVEAAHLSIEQRSAFVMSAYEIGLELVGERVAGNDARGRVLEEAWRQIVPIVSHYAEPNFDRFLAAVSNAIHNLANADGARVQEWLTEMVRLANVCTDVDTLLKVGQILAWRAGMAHLRQGALEVAASLSPALALAAIGAPPSAQWPTIYDALKRDAWFRPQTSDPSMPRILHLAGKVGRFRGLGGLFSQPPQVAASAEQIFVRSGDDCWLLVADVFGWSLHNAKLAEFAAARAEAQRTGVVVTTASISARGSELKNPLPGEITSYAVLPDTIALTSAFTHSVLLLAY